MIESVIAGYNYSTVCAPKNARKCVAFTEGVGIKEEVKGFTENRRAVDRY